MPSPSSASTNTLFFLYFCMALTKDIGECFLFEVAILGTLEGGSMGVGWGIINMTSGV